MPTENVPPADVHEIGLKEVARITAEMTKLAQGQGYKDLASFREAVNNDPKWKPTSEQQILDDYKKYIHQMEPKLPELFDGCIFCSHPESVRSEEHTSELQSHLNLVCRLLLEKKKNKHVIKRIHTL